MALDERDPLQHAAVGGCVVDAPRPCDDDHVAQRLFELLVLPLAVACTDALDQAARSRRPSTSSMATDNRSAERMRDRL